MAIEYSIVIPVFNEAENLVDLNNEIIAAGSSLDGDFEIIYVDDQSSDTSLELMYSFESENSSVRTVCLAKHAGQSAALCAGFKSAQGEWIITLDADLQTPPAEIKKLVPHKGTYDMINGVRAHRQDTTLRRFSSSVARLTRRIILGDQTPDVGCSLRMIRREVTEVVPLFRNFHRFFPYLAARCGFNIVHVVVEHRKRKSGKSKYTTLGRLLEGIFDLGGVFWLSRRIMRKP